MMLDVTPQSNRSGDANLVRLSPEVFRRVKRLAMRKGISHRAAAERLIEGPNEMDVLSDINDLGEHLERNQEELEEQIRELQSGNPKVVARAIAVLEELASAWPAGEEDDQEEEEEEEEEES